MPMYSDVPTVRSSIVFNRVKKQYETQLWFNNKIKSITPTPESQISPRRQSLLWMGGIGFFLASEFRHKNSTTSSYNPLEEE